MRLENVWPHFVHTLCIKQQHIWGFQTIAFLLIVIITSKTARQITDVNLLVQRVVVLSSSSHWKCILNGFPKDSTDVDNIYRILDFLQSRRQMININQDKYCNPVEFTQAINLHYKHFHFHHFILPLHWILEANTSLPFSCLIILVSLHISF